MAVDTDPYSRWSFARQWSASHIYVRPCGRVAFPHPRSRRSRFLLRRQVRRCTLARNVRVRSVEDLAALSRVAKTYCAFRYVRWEVGNGGSAQAMLNIPHKWSQVLLS